MSSSVTVGGEQNIRRDWDPSVRPEMRDGDRGGAEKREANVFEGNKEGLIKEMISTMKQPPNFCFFYLLD